MIRKLIPNYKETIVLGSDEMYLMTRIRRRSSLCWASLRWRRC